MKVQISTRRILTVLSILVTCGILALLSMPELFGTKGLLLLTVLFGLEPLLLIATLISYIFARAIKNDTAKTRPKKIERMVAAGIVAGSVLGIFFTKLSEHMNLDTKFVYENIGTSLVVSCFILAVALINSQNFIYWPLWNRSDKQNADERQTAVRLRVFEKAYRYLICVLFVEGLLYDNNQLHTSQMLLAVTALLVMGLPSIIAAWQKDS